MAASSYQAVPPSEQPGILFEEEAHPGMESAVRATDYPAFNAPEPAEPVAAHKDGDNSEAKGWEQARARFAADAVLEAHVSGYNKGGLLVRWNGLQGFVPASQLENLTQLHVKEKRLRQLEARVGENVSVRIIELDESADRLIFSERATQISASRRDALLTRLRSGEVLTGRVTNLADFGAFVDLGGVEGLIHISQLSWRRLYHPSDAVKPGEEVRVLVLSVDADRGRVALSRKQLQADPWIGVEERYRPQQEVVGEITNLSDFGAFVLLEEGLEGLIHLSEMSTDSSCPDEVLSKGDRVQARVLAVSEKERRLALTLCGIVDGSDAAGVQSATVQ
jgi:small subunit ribosomal protein S1